MKDAGRRLLGIDWGTTNRRAYLIGDGGACLDWRADDQGILTARPDFGLSLTALLSDMRIAPTVPVVASGMIGSAQGWKETPYLDTTVALESLPGHLIKVRDDSSGCTCLLVPGYRWQDQDGRVDVMRGEEMQLLGAVSRGRRDGWFVLPGTHSKWVRLEDGLIRHLSTFMTGELFATLGKLGTLAPMMAGPHDDDAFVAGVDQAKGRALLTTALFAVRARVVTGAMPAAHVRSFVSGLLIGAELVAALDLMGHRHGAVTMVAAAKLRGYYATAAAHLGIELLALNADDVYAAAMGVFLDTTEAP